MMEMIAERLDACRLCPPTTLKNDDGDEGYTAELRVISPSFAWHDADMREAARPKGVWALVRPSFLAADGFARRIAMALRHLQALFLRSAQFWRSRCWKTRAASKPRASARSARTPRWDGMKERA